MSYCGIDLCKVGEGLFKVGTNPQNPLVVKK